MTDLALDDLNGLVSKSVEDNETAIATFLNIKRAFNHASTDYIATALDRRRAAWKICKWVKTSLQNRTIIAILGETDTGTVIGRTLLWAILVDDLVRKLLA